jgi:hypothetical protein
MDTHVADYDLIEVYPGNNAWGRLGWTWAPEQMAETHFDFLVRHGIKLTFPGVLNTRRLGKLSFQPDRFERLSYRAPGDGKGVKSNKLYFRYNVAAAPLETKYWHDFRDKTVEVDRNIVERVPGEFLAT